mgnify:CR=1 FL=1
MTLLSYGPVLVAVASSVGLTSWFAFGPAAAPARRSAVRIAVLGIAVLPAAAGILGYLLAMVRAFHDVAAVAPEAKAATLSRWIDQAMWAPIIGFSSLSLTIGFAAWAVALGPLRGPGQTRSSPRSEPG